MNLSADMTDAEVLVAYSKLVDETGGHDWNCGCTDCLDLDWCKEEAVTRLKRQQQQPQIQGKYFATTRSVQDGDKVRFLTEWLKYHDKKRIRVLVEEEKG